MGHTLREIALYILFFKTVYYRLHTVNADLRTPHLPVNNSFTKNYGIL